MYAIDFRDRRTAPDLLEAELEKIKVMLIDDHNVLRQSLAKALRLEFDIEVAGQFSSAEDALREWKAGSCNVVIMDLKLSGINGIKATRRLLEMDPELKVMVLSAYTGDDEVFSAIEAGVSGYLPKESTVEEVVDAIRSVNRGHAVLGPQVARSVIEKIAARGKASPKTQTVLEPVEMEILTLASSGAGNKEIAESLKLNDGAIKFHLREIFKKLGARDRTNAVSIALKQGLIQ